MKPSLAAALTSLTLGTVLLACGSEEAAVCGSIDNLKASVSDTKDVDVTSEGGLSDLLTALDTVKTDLAAVKADAKSEFSSQVQEVDDGFSSLSESVETATAAPSAASLQAAASALSSWGTQVEGLISDVQSTC